LAHDGKSARAEIPRPAGESAGLRNDAAGKSGANFLKLRRGLASLRKVGELGLQYVVMRKQIAASVVILLASLVGIPLAVAQGKDAPAKDAAPDVPDSIQAPVGEEVVLYTHATGSQIYTCQAAADGNFGWTLKAPEAELHDRKEKVIGQHSVGPTWKLKDGSEVTGKAVAKVDALDAESIPWLLVHVVGHAGSGLLSNVTTIQRVHTRGGQAPAQGCDAAHRDAETKSSYTADYYFYAPAK
jgi:hypothetical protein